MEKTVLIFILCLLFNGCKQYKNTNTNNLHIVEYKDVSSLEEKVEESGILELPEFVSQIKPNENYIYVCNFYNSLPNIYYFSLTLHPKPYFVSHQFIEKKVNKNSIVFIDPLNLIVDNKEKYDSILSLSSNKQLLKDSIISINQEDARFIDKMATKYFFNRTNPAKYLVLNDYQLKDSIKKHNINDVDYYLINIIPKYLE